ncbi:MAG: hypothetical protein PHF44_00520 [Candidatus Pacebacteria bacterium]|nr:hypothetical protein [Candidatus Paceibacterota bacterium]
MIKILHELSIGFEAIVTVLGAILAVSKKKNYGWLISLTFGIYVFYDLARFLSFDLSADILYIAFFIASLSITFAVWKIYREK